MTDAFKEGQKVKLVWSRLTGIVEQVTVTHVFLKFRDGSRGMYTHSCVSAVAKERR